MSKSILAMAENIDGEAVTREERVLMASIFVRHAINRSDGKSRYFAPHEAQAVVTITIPRDSDPSSWPVGTRSARRYPCC